MENRPNVEREQGKRRLSAEVTELLRSAAEALERLAPEQFEAIGARALDLDRLMIHATAAATLTGSRLKFDAAIAPDLYSTTDWAATGARLQSVAGRLTPLTEPLLEVTQEPGARRIVFAAEEPLWHR